MEYRQATPGMAVAQSPARSAGWINAVSEATRDYHERQRLGDAAKTLPAPRAPLRVRNNTGGDLARGSVVELGDGLLDTPDPRRIWLGGGSYDGGAMAIVGDPIADGAIGVAYVSGVVVARVNVANITHGYADPATSQTTLASGTTGSVRILSTLSATGVQDCLVLLGAGEASANEGVATLDATLSGGATATVVNYVAVRGTLSPPATTDNVDNPLGLSGSIGDPVEVVLSGGDWTLTRIETNTSPQDRRFAASADDSAPGDFEDKFTGHIVGSQPTDTKPVKFVVTGGPCDESIAGYARVFDAGVAELYAGLAAVDANGLVATYDPFCDSGEAPTLGGAGTSIANPHGLSGAVGDAFIVALLDGTWTFVRKIPEATDQFKLSADDTDAGYWEGKVAGNVASQPTGTQQVQYVTAPDGGNELVTLYSQDERFACSANDTAPGNFDEQVYGEVGSQPNKTRQVQYVVGPDGGDEQITLYSEDERFAASADDASPGNFEAKFAGAIAASKPATAQDVEFVVTGGPGNETIAAHAKQRLRNALARLDGDLATGDANGGVQAVRLLDHPGGTVAVTTATNPYSESGVDEQNVLLREMSGGGWEIVAPLNVLDAIGRATLAGATAGSSVAVENYRPWTADVSAPPASPTTVQNPYGLTGNAGDEVVVSRIGGVWAIRAKLGGQTATPLLPAQVIGYIAGASRSGSSLTMGSGTVQLLEGTPPNFAPYDPTQNVTAYWAGAGTIDGSTSAPVFAWLSYDGTNYYIVTADVCG